MKQDLDQLVQKKDLMTRQPGWRTNVSLKIKISKMSQKCKRMKNEIHKRYCLQSTQKMDGTKIVAVVIAVLTLIFGCLLIPSACPWSLSCS